MLAKFIPALFLVSQALAVAPIATDSPVGAKAIAVFHTGIEGSVAFASTSNGTVEVSVNLADLPSSGGPFLYHIHEHPTANEGNCSTVGGHLNPYNGSMSATSPPLMQVGDLSGKHGTITSDPFNVTYNDPYLSLDPSDPAYIGGLSVVVHYANATIYACTNLTIVDTEASNTSNSTSSSVSAAGGQSVTTNGFLAGLMAVGMALFL